MRPAVGFHRSIGKAMGRTLRLRIITWLVVLSAACLAVVPTNAVPVEVRFTEGVSKGFVLLREPSGQRLAEGEVSQMATGADRVVNRLLLRFEDGSVHDERVAFSQKQTFKMLRYQLEQRGPSFPRPLTVTLDGESGAYTVREGKAPEDAPVKGTIHLPPDVYNGLTVTVLKNIPASKDQSFHIVTFSPEATLYQVLVRPVGIEQVQVGGRSTQAVHYRMTPQLGRWTKLLAWALDKPIPQYDFWFTKDGVPAFVRFEGPLYADGPTWQMVQTAPGAKSY